MRNGRRRNRSTTQPNSGLTRLGAAIASMTAPAWLFEPVSDFTQMPRTRITGGFFGVVAANLNRGVPYRYLLYGERTFWLPQVATFRNLVERSGVPVEVSRENLLFRWLPEELLTSLCILDLDVTLAEREEPILWERHRDNISSDGVRAYLSIERSDAQGGITLEPLYLQSAIRQFDRDWALAKQL